MQADIKGEMPGKALEKEINRDNWKNSKSGSHLFHFFLSISLIASVVIVIMIGSGLFTVIRDYVICEAERDANRVSVALRNSIMSRFIQKHPGGENEFSVPEEAIEELDKSFRKFLAPFNIVKIKVFDTDTQIIYSTDPGIIGKLNKNNAKLSSALNGMSVSKYETKEHVWDLAEEQHADVGIVETYVPVYDSDNRVIGSFEIYKDVTTELASATSVLIIAIATTSVIVFGTFAILIFIMHHATGKINSMTLALTKSNNELELALEHRKEVGEKLRENIKEIEQFNKLAVGRELQMIELKKEIDTLLCEFGREEKYKSDYEKMTSEPLS